MLNFHLDQQIFYPFWIFQYCHQKDYTFKSSLFCVVGVWLLVVFSETFQLGIHHNWCVCNHTTNSTLQNCTNPHPMVPIRVTLISTILVTLGLTGSLAIIVMESWLPKAMKRLSYTLIHDRNKRNSVIFITFSIMYLATGIAVVSLRLFSVVICITVSSIFRSIKGSCQIT